MALFHARKKAAQDHSRKEEAIEVSYTHVLDEIPEARSEMVQTQPVRVILWPNETEINRLAWLVETKTSIESTRFKSRESNVQTVSPEEASLLENSEQMTYGAEFEERCWESFVLPQINEIRRNESSLSYIDISRRIREFSFILRSRQPLWKDLKFLKTLKDRVSAIESSFLNPASGSFDLRLAQSLIWKAKRSVAGEENWSVIYSQAVGKILRGPMKEHLPEESVSSISALTDPISFLSSLHSIVISAVFGLGSEPDLSVVNEIDSAEEQHLLRLSDLILLSELIETKRIAKDQESRIFSRIDSSTIAIPGPLGESPVHVCILLGLKDVACKMIERFYTTPELVSVQYQNDLAPWRRCDCLPPELEDGMYTGETCLHMAILQEDVQLVGYLLDKNIDLMARATGRFFQPRLIRQRILGLDVWRLLSERWSIVREENARSEGCTASFLQMMGMQFEGGEDQHLTAWQLLYAWASGLFFTSRVRGARSLTVVNELSSCYYGEYPLSFAASVGNTIIADLLYTYQQTRCEAHGARAAAAERAESARQKLRRAGSSVSLASDGGAAAGPELRGMPLFIGAMDAFGNTALHMAVLHRRRDMVDWLLGKPEGRACLELLNGDGLTPLTMAARHGDARLFHHMLYGHLSEVVWVCGKVALDVCARARARKHTRDHFPRARTRAFRAPPSPPGSAIWKTATGMMRKGFFWGTVCTARHPDLCEGLPPGRRRPMYRPGKL